MKKLILFAITLFFLTDNANAQLEAGVSFDYSYLFRFDNPESKGTSLGGTFFLQGYLGKNTFLRTGYSKIKYQVNGKDFSFSDNMKSIGLGYYFKSRKKVSKFSFPVYITVATLKKRRIGLWGFRCGVKYQHNYRWSFFSELNQNFVFKNPENSYREKSFYSISIGAAFNLIPFKRLKKGG